MLLIKKTFRLLILIVTVFISSITNAQLNVTRNTNANALAQQLAGPGITVSNATLKCNANASGTFTGALAATNINAGIILSTGDVIDSKNGGLLSSGTSFGTPGDADLNTLITQTTQDACILEFDIDVVSSKIQFNFVFGSNEYPEFSSASFNDVFGYFISGPGIAGKKNIALLPGTTTAVSIKNVNNGDANNGPCANCTFYRPNRGPATGYDGTTVLLKAEADVQACETYHLKLAIGDVGDGAYDSMVLLEENSLVSVGVDAQPPILSNNLQDTIYEGCDNAVFEFLLTTPLNSNYTFPIVFKGTATDGVDYPSVPGTVTIPAGQLKGSVTITPNEDGIPEGAETVEICALDPCTGAELSCQTVQIADFEASASTDVQICYGATTQLEIFANPEFIYKWTPTTGLSCSTCPNPVASPTVTTTYKGSVQVQNCIKEFDILVEVAPEKLPDLDDLKGCEDEVLSGVSGALPPCTYLWSPTTGVSNPTIPNPTFTVQKTVIDYTLTATHPFGCTYTEKRKVTPNEPIKFKASSTNILCFGDNAGSITITKLSTDPLTFLWNDGVSTQSRNNLPAGTYTVTMTSSNGCEKDSTITITQPAKALEVEAVETKKSYCNGQDGLAEATVKGGTQPYTYRWSPAGGTASTTVPLFPGIDTCIVTDANGCIAKDTVKIGVEGSQKDATITPAGPFCTITGDQQLTTAMPAGVWQGTGVNASGVFSPASAGNGNHRIIYTIADGLCSDADTIFILVNNAFQADINPAGPFCELASPVKLTSVTPGGTWTGNGIANPNSSTFDPGAAGVGTHKIYHLIPGACGELDSTFITVTKAVQAKFDFVPEFCPYGSTQKLTASPAGGTFFGVGVNATGDFNPGSVGKGQFNIKYTPSLACSLPADTTVNVVDTLKAIQSNFALACNGDANAIINTTTTGGKQPLSFTWSNDASNNTRTATGLAAGTYTFTATDALGCQATVVHFVTQPSKLIFSATPTLVHNSCNGSNNGTAQIFPSGGTSPYALDLFPNSGAFNGADTYTNLPANTYTVTLKDANNCTVTDNFTITEPAAIAITSTVNTAYCGKPDGSITINSVNGGTAPYTYSWSNGSTSQNLNTVVSGTYTLTITDSKNCVFSEAFTVPDTPGPTVSFTATDPTCFNGTNGSIVATPTTAGSYTYAWSDLTGQTSANSTFSNIGIGTYTLVLTDNSNGCSSTNTISLGQPSQVIVTDVRDSLLCDGQAWSVNLAATGGNGSPYSFSINGAAITGSVYAISSPGVYTIDATDALGCVAVNDVFRITYRNPLSVSLVPLTTVCPGDLISLTATPNGGKPPYTYTWSTGQTGQTINIPTDENTSNETITVTLNDGCSTPATTTTIINTYPVPSLNPTAVPMDGCEPLITRISLNTSNVNNIVWTMGDGNTLPDLTDFDYEYATQGSYLVSVTGKSVDGCNLSGGIPQPIQVYPLPTGSIQALHSDRLTIINNAGSFRINANYPLGAVQWVLTLNGDTITKSNSQKFVYQFPDSVTTYLLHATFFTPYGCPGEAFIEVPVYNEYFFYVPNTFTPDGDGYNELFFIGWGRFQRTDFHILIFDRWGEELFEADDPDFTWDGKYQGEIVRSGTYVWKIDFRTLEGELKTEFGTINVLH